jgi:hypothetical protein
MKVRERHYPRIAGLIPRTATDVTDAALRVRAHAFPFTTAALAPKPERPRLVSSADGPFTQLLFTIPRYAVESAPLAGAYTQLLSVLPPDLAPVVLTHAGVEQTVRGWVAGFPAAEVIAAPDHLYFSVWAEDGYAVCRDDVTGGTFFVEPFSFPRYADGLIADFVANATGLSNSQAPLYFQGGNILIGGDFFMIGADYPARSLEYVGSVLSPDPGETRPQLIRRLYGEYLDATRTLHYVGSTIPVPNETQRAITVNGQPWTEVLYFGNREGTVQPLFHIDMFLTLAGRGGSGKDRVLVGDPRMAADILGEPVQGHAMPEVFDNIARGLSRQGFEVIRNPLPLVYLDDVERRERVWYFATSNNALVAAVAGGGTVWLPTYGHGAWSELSATDEQNTRLWQGLGFTVRHLADFHPFAENLGAVHCIKKYLKRA